MQALVTSLVDEGALPWVGYGHHTMDHMQAVVTTLVEEGTDSCAVCGHLNSG